MNSAQPIIKTLDLTRIVAEALLNVGEELPQHVRVEALLLPDVIRVDVLTTVGVQTGRLVDVCRVTTALGSRPVRGTRVPTGVPALRLLPCIGGLLAIARTAGGSSMIACDVGCSSASSSAPKPSIVPSWTMVTLRLILPVVWSNEMPLRHIASLMITGI
jgi:hypothetical protein